MNARIVAAALLLACSSPGLAHEAERPHRGPADNYVYELAAPGSYELPPIKHAADGKVRDETGAPRRLAEITRGKITMMSFVYTQCVDLCPLATMRMALFQDLVAEQPDLARDVRLVTMSFDPVRDTPERMAEQAALWRADAGPEWLFVTSPDEASLKPVLAAYDQRVVAVPGPDGAEASLTHVLRVFLIDADGVIRNIYSADFLDPRLMFNDVLTLRGAGGTVTVTAPSE
jgi:cytochrome oxidase Cu insertion factor (SCO1/SenC/PrrC family)